MAVGESIGRCPGCDAVLRPRLTTHGVVHECTRCDGCGATLEVLRRAEGQAAVAAIWAAIRPARREGPRRCPSCRRALATVDVSGRAGTVDGCASCQWIWFDRGAALRDASAPRQGGVLARVDPQERERVARLMLDAVPVDTDALDHEPDATWKWVPGLLGLPVTVGAEPASDPPWLTWSVAVLLAVLALLAWLQPEAGGALGFAHDRWLLPLLNLWFLLVFGPLVERDLKPARYALLLVAAHACGLVATRMLHADAVPLGANPAIAGLVAYVGLRLPRQRIGHVFWWGGYVRWLNFPAGWWVALWAAGEIVAFALGDTATGAHLAGALPGLVASALHREARNPS